MLVAGAEALSLPAGESPSAVDVRARRGGSVSMPSGDVSAETPPVVDANRISRAKTVANVPTDPLSPNGIRNAFLIDSISHRSSSASTQYSEKSPKKIKKIKDIHHSPSAQLHYILNRDSGSSNGGDSTEASDEKLSDGAATPHSPGSVPQAASEAALEQLMREGVVKWRAEKQLDKQKECQRLFNLAESEYVIEDYSCALQRKLLLQGRLYICTSCMCFYSNILGHRTRIVLPYADVYEVKKKTTAFLVPNAIKVRAMAVVDGDTKPARYVFTSFLMRDQAFRKLTRVWELYRHLNVGGALSLHPTQSSQTRDGADDDTGSTASTGVESSDGSDNDHDNDDDDDEVLTADADPRTPSKQHAVAEGVSSLSQKSSSVQREKPAEISVGDADRSVDGRTHHPSIKRIASDSPGSASDSAAKKKSRRRSQNDVLAVAVPSPEVPSEVEAVRMRLRRTYDDIFPPYATWEEEYGMESICEADFGNAPALWFWFQFVRDGFPIIRDYHIARSDLNIEVDPAVNITDSGATFPKRVVRELRWKATKPRSSRMHEYHRYTLVSPYEMHAELSTHVLDVPFGDSFRAVTYMRLIQSSKTSAATHVSMMHGVRFVKSNWLKGKIRSMSIKGNRSAFSVWPLIAKQHFDQCPLLVPVKVLDAEFEPQSSRRSIDAGERGIGDVVEAEPTAEAVPSPVQAEHVPGSPVRPAIVPPTPLSPTEFAEQLRAKEEAAAKEVLLFGPLDEIARRPETLVYSMWVLILLLLFIVFFK